LAVLAGDALLNLAYETLIGLEISPTRKVEIVARLAGATGASGVLGGQVEDIEAEGREISEPALRRIHRWKTASLISVSLCIGGVLAGGNRNRLERLDRFGIELGLLFQQVDDLLNVEGNAVVLGRPCGGDAESEKATYPRIVGIEGARRRMRRRINATLREADTLGRWSPLLASLVETVVSRLPAAAACEEGV